MNTKESFGISIMISENKKGKRFDLKLVNSRIYIWFLSLFIKIVFIF
jgi:hypothetical protein